MMVFEYYQKYQTARDIFLPLEEIKKRAGSKRDAYCSIFGYDPKDITHGDIFGGLYFDFDSEDKVERAYSDAKNLIEILTFYGLSDNDYQLCFSGFKGFHFTIHPAVLGAKPRPDLDKIYKKIAGWLFYQLPNNTLDFTVYERRRLWRILNTINSKSGLYKICINGKETLAEILEKAKSPQPVKQMSPSLNPIAKDWITRALQEIKDDSFQISSHKVYSQDKNINESVMLQIKSGAPQNQRNNSAFFIACYLRAKGYNQNEIEQHLFEFAANCNPPLGQKEIISVIRSAFIRSL